MEAADALFCEALRRIVWARKSELLALARPEDREDLRASAESYRQEAMGLIATGLDYA
ncbi:hypothetical protein [Caulobacter segnis]